MVFEIDVFPYNRSHSDKVSAKFKCINLGIFSKKQSNLAFPTSSEKHNTDNLNTERFTHIPQAVKNLPTTEEEDGKMSFFKKFFFLK